MNELANVEKGSVEQAKAYSPRGGYLTPATSIYEDSGKVIVTLEMPGVSKTNIDLRVDGDELSIIGTPAVEEVKGSYLARERRVGQYRKVFTIDQTIDRERVEAFAANGLVTLTLHLREAAKPRRIEVA